MQCNALSIDASILFYTRQNQRYTFHQALQNSSHKAASFCSYLFLHKTTGGNLKQFAIHTHPIITGLLV